VCKNLRIKKKKKVGKEFTTHKMLQGILKNETLATNETKCFEK
jgi:hypothetical protein